MKKRIFWKQFILQTLLATVVVFVVLLILDWRHQIVIASIAATAFLAFLIPHNVCARAKNIIGGYSIGLISGSLWSLISHTVFPADVLVCVGAVGCTIFVMVITKTEHPPAVAAALGIAIIGFSLDVTVILLISISLISVARGFLLCHLRDLA